MDDHELIQNVLIDCSPTNLYSGLDIFRQYAKQNPTRALEIGWEKITKCPDEDDGALITSILMILSDVSFEQLRRRLLEEWKHIDQQHRRAIVSAAARNDVLPLADWLRFFYDEYSTVQDRHLLAAALVSGAYSKDFRPHAARCIENIGRYDEEWHNEILLGFIENVRKHFRQNQPT